MERECPKCGNKSLRIEVSAVAPSETTVPLVYGEALLKSKPVSTISFQCRECGAWFS